MLAARMYGYKQPLVVEEVKIPEILADQVLVRVGSCGMCRSDVQLVDGYFEALNLKLPITPGHEIAGLVEKIGDGVPATAQLAVGDQVVVATGWGDGTCRECRVGNEQICEHGSWPGFGPPGGYGEFMPVPYRHLIRVEPKLKWEELAPLTDAGVTPYRGIKKLRAEGVLGPDRVMGVFGASGLDSVSKLNGAIQCHPAHQLGIKEVTRLTAHLPDSLVLFLPAHGSGVGQVDQKFLGSVINGFQLFPQQVNGAQELAVNVNLSLVPGTIANSNRAA